MKEEIESALKELGAKNGLEIAFDENGACTLGLADERVLILQERDDLNELDFVANLGPVPEEIRGAVFTDLLAANFYWKETFGATLSWNADLEEVVLIYPLSLADATPESVETIFTRFAELQDMWAERLAGMISAAQKYEAGESDEEDEEDAADDAEAGEEEKDDLIINP